MQVNKNGLIAGLRNDTLKKLLQSLTRPKSIEEVAERLEWAHQRTQELIDALVTLDYVQSSEGLVALVEKGRDFVNAKFVDHLTRRMADIALQKAIETAHILNTHSHWAISVAELRVYGSYLTEAHDFSHLDMTIRFQSKSSPSDTENYERVLALFRGIHKRLRLVVADSDAAPILGSKLLYDMNGAEPELRPAASGRPSLTTI
jgi:hypothetical protein